MRRLLAWLEKAMEAKEERVRKRSEALNLHHQDLSNEYEKELVLDWGEE